MISQNTDETVLKDYENEYFAKIILSWASNIIGTETWRCWAPPRPNFLMDRL